MICDVIDLDAATRFMATHARLLDRLRLDVRLGRGGEEALLGALAGHRNPDGGYGRGLEPDLRSRTSQPGGALHAFEVFADADSPAAAQLCDWCDRVALEGGALPFAFDIPDPAGCAPFWVAADPAQPSLQITAIVAAAAHHVPSIAGHPWLERATAWCRAEVEALTEPPFAMALAFAAQLFDAAGDEATLEKLAPMVPHDGLLPIPGGSEGETMRPVDFAPSLFSSEVFEADLDRLEAGQREDGGWRVDYASFSPAAELEWRGAATVKAVRTLQRHGRV